MKGLFSITKKWLIVYSSNTGNTRQIADAMHQKLSEGIADIYTIKEITDDFSFDDYDIIAVGYWLTRGGPDMQVQKLLKRLENKHVVFFQTHGTEKYSEHSITAFARAASYLGDNCDVLGTFACQGKINPVLLNRARAASDDDPHAANERNMKRWANAAQHPNNADLKDAGIFIDAMQRKIVLRDKYQQALLKKRANS